MTRGGPVLCCPDKFRGSLTAGEAAAALVAGVGRAGRPAMALPLADGGEGTLDVLCPAGDHAARSCTGPLGDPVDAEWGVRGDTAVIEMARASGLALVDENDPLVATTFGTASSSGQRSTQASGARSWRSAGRRRSTAARRARGARLRPPRSEVVVACDVSTTFVDAARIFGPQKGADAAAVQELERRLELLADRYRREPRGRRPRCPAPVPREASLAASPRTVGGSSPGRRSSRTWSACATRSGARRSSSPARAASTPRRSRQGRRARARERGRGPSGRGRGRRHPARDRREVLMHPWSSWRLGRARARTPLASPPPRPRRLARTHKRRVTPLAGAGTAPSPGRSAATLRAGHRTHRGNTP